jgi:hypothetical protein
MQTLLRMKTFCRDVTMNANDAIIPITAKFCMKLKSAGAIDKLKVRTCLRSDMQQKGEWET